MDIAGRYGVMNVPTLILFKDGRLWSGRWAFRAPLTSESSWIRFYKRGPFHWLLRPVEEARR